jgi:phosphohistidine phosphatase
MELFVMRHATAEPRRPGYDDEKRALTRRGRERWKCAVEGLRDLKVSVDRLLHSPWLRAVETADLAKELVDGERVETHNLVVAPRQTLLDELRGQRVAVIGHEPWLTELIAWLVLGDPSAGSQLVLKKGGVAWLEGEPRPGQMKLRALFTPRSLRR